MAIARDNRGITESPPIAYIRASSAPSSEILGISGRDCKTETGNGVTSRERDTFLFSKGLIHGKPDFKVVIASFDDGLWLAAFRVPGGFKWQAYGSQREALANSVVNASHARNTFRNLNLRAA